MERSPIVLFASFGALAATLARPVFAQAPECQAPRLHLHVDLEAKPAWAATLPALRADLHGARIDRCADVEIRPQGEDVVVTVSSRGRSASRLLSEPSELVRTVEALIVLPPEVESPAELPPSEPALPAKPPAPEPIRVELAAGADLRLSGDVYGGAGFSALADVVVDRYLLGVTGRWDSDGYLAEPTASGFAMESGAIGIALGRRFDVPGVTLDALLGVQVVVESQEVSGATAAEAGGETLDMRGGMGLRASSGKPSGFRPYLVADVEASPARVARPRQLDSALPVLPSWSTGLGLGVLWGVR